MSSVERQVTDRDVHRTCRAPGCAIELQLNAQQLMAVNIGYGIAPHQRAPRNLYGLRSGRYAAGQQRRQTNVGIHAVSPLACVSSGVVTRSFVVEVQRIIRGHLHLNINSRTAQIAQNREREAGVGAGIRTAIGSEVEAKTAIVTRRNARFYFETAANDGSGGRVRCDVVIHEGPSGKRLAAVAPRRFSEAVVAVLPMVISEKLVMSGLVGTVVGEQLLPPELAPPLALPPADVFVLVEPPVLVPPLPPLLVPVTALLSPPQPPSASIEVTTAKPTPPTIEDTNFMILFLQPETQPPTRRLTYPMQSCIRTSPRSRPQILEGLISRWQPRHGGSRRDTLSPARR